MPVLAVLSIPPPPGWDRLPTGARVEYVAVLAAAGIKVNWSTK